MANKLENLDIMIVNSVTLGHYWGITDRRVRQLREEGVISEVARGKFDLVESTRRYCNFLRQQASANAGNKEVKLSLDTEKALHEKAKREKAELTLKIMKGEVHRGSDVEQVMTDMITRCKTKLLSIPSKTAPMVMGYKDIGRIQAILQKQVEQALLELVDYNTELFRNDEMLKGDEDE